METSTLTVKPTLPVAGYIGGKRALASRVTSIIDDAALREDLDGYAEPFVGMGGIMLRRRRAARVEVINDISGDVVTFFRVIQEHYAYFLDLMRFRLASRAEFERLLAMPAERLTDLQRAARFLYVQRLAFGGKVAGRAFGVDSRQGARFNMSKLEPLLADLHERLQPVIIEQLDYRDFIRRYDRAGMLFYIDPPYFGCEGDYGRDIFCRDDFAALAELLRSLRGRFLMSINDRREIRDLFRDFDIMPVATTYSIARAGCAAASARELLISNLDLSPWQHLRQG